MNVSPAHRAAVVFMVARTMSAIRVGTSLPTPK